MRILVCGGRDFDNFEAIAMALNYARELRGPITEIIHGGAKGADSLAGKWARLNGIRETVFAAEWRKHGDAAGPIRNTKMLSEGKPERVIAFPGGAGTADMVAKAKRARLLVWEVKCEVRKVEGVAA